MKLHLPYTLRTALIACLFAGVATAAETKEIMLDTLSAPGKLVGGTSNNAQVTSAAFTAESGYGTLTGLFANTGSWYVSKGYNNNTGTFQSSENGVVLVAGGPSGFGRSSIGGIEFSLEASELAGYADTLTLSFEVNRKAGNNNKNHAVTFYLMSEEYTLTSSVYNTKEGDNLLSTDESAPSLVTLEFSAEQVAAMKSTGKDQLFVFVAQTDAVNGSNTGVHMKNFKWTGTEVVPLEDVYYWEKTGSAADWTDVAWATNDNLRPTLSRLPETATVIFNNVVEGGVTVTVDTAAKVTNVSIAAGSYTFEQGTRGSLEVAGTLSVEAGATADIRLGVKAGQISTAGNLTLTGMLETGGIVVKGSEATLTVQDATLYCAIENQGGTVELKGDIALSDSFLRETGEEYIPDGNELGGLHAIYTIVTGEGAINVAEDTSWTVDGKAYTSVSFNGGVLDAGVVYDRYYVTNGTVEYDGGSDFDAAAALSLNGGTLQLNTGLDELKVYSTEAGGTLDLNGQRVRQESFGELNGEILLTGGEGSVYAMGDTCVLAENLSLAEDWTGTVQVDNLDAAEHIDVSALTTADSKLEMTAVQVADMRSTSAGSISCGTLALLAGESSVAGDLFVGHGRERSAEVLQGLTLGCADSAATLKVGGTLHADKLTLGNADSSVAASSLQTSGNPFVVYIEDDDVFRKLSKTSGGAPITLVSLDEACTDAAELVTEYGGLRFSATLKWSEDGKSLQFRAEENTNFVYDMVAASSTNGEAGADLLHGAYQESDPQVENPEGTLARLLDAVESGLVDDKGAAAVAGASVATLGMAASSDMERQLRAIRNRTTSMGVDVNLRHEEMPYFNAWINAEANNSKLDQDGTQSGYSLNSWGGTVGFDVDVAPSFTVGMAFTAMYGDYETEGPDSLKGDMDSCYLSLFARYAAAGWTHTFVGSVGKMEASLERTVAAGRVKYETEGDTDGQSFGLLYEAGYVIPVNESGSTCVQPVFNVMLRHSEVDGYTEQGAGDASLEVDSQSMTTVTLGLGARLQTVTGEDLFNRTSVFETRLLGKVHLGDRSSEADVSLPDTDCSVAVESAEQGALGLELGAGIIVPLSDTGAIFVDGSVEINSGYNNLNATLGYRLNF